MYAHILIHIHIHEFFNLLLLQVGTYGYQIYACCRGEVEYIFEELLMIFVIFFILMIIYILNLSLSLN